MHPSFTTYSRRNFLGKFAALICSGLTFPAKAFSSSSKSLLRSTPNPDCGHLSLAVAEDLCSLHRQNILSDNEARADVDGFVAGNESFSERTAPWSLAIPFGSRHDARMNRLFLQLCWAS
jgi:hypothetical protein